MDSSIKYVSAMRQRLIAMLMHVYYEILMALFSDAFPLSFAKKSMVIPRNEQVVKRKTSIFDCNEFERMSKLNTMKITKPFHSGGPSRYWYQFDRIKIECFPLFSEEKVT